MAATFVVFGPEVAEVDLAFFLREFVGRNIKLDILNILFFKTLRNSKGKQGKKRMFVRVLALIRWCPNLWRAPYFVKNSAGSNFYIMNAIANTSFYHHFFS